MYLIFLLTLVMALPTIILKPFKNENLNRTKIIKRSSYFNFLLFEFFIL
jgi:hypothetical protein